MRVLVVDDDKMILTAIAKKLKEKHYQVTTTVDPVEALKIISDKKIDLIISDVLMPCITGFTFLSMLRNFYYSKIPMIIISSYGYDEVIQRAKHLGACYFFSKPIDYNELVAKVEEFTSDAA